MFSPSLHFYVKFITYRRKILLEVYFIRHAQSTNNLIMEQSGYEEYLFERTPEPDITPLGHGQAQLLGDFVARPSLNGQFDPQNRAGVGLTHLYCSLMIRAIKTGQAVAKKTGLPLVAWPDVHETGGLFDVTKEDGEPVFFGVPGHGRDFFSKKFPDLVIPEDLSHEGWWNRDKEPREAYQERARGIVEDLILKHGEKDHRVAIITHGGIFARILSAILEVQAPRYWFLMNNCGISRIDFDDDGRINLLYLNKVDYLPDDMIT